MMVEQIKRWPGLKKLTCHNNGESVDVAIPTQRKKWQRLEATLGALQPDRIEGFDKDGNLVGLWQGEDVEDEVIEMPSEKSAEVHAMVQLVVQAQDAALSRHQKALESVFQMQGELLRVTQDRLHTLEKQQEANIKVIQDLMTSAGGDDSEMMKQFAPLIGQFLASQKKLQ